MYPRLTISGSPWRLKPITLGGERRGGGNKVHGVIVRDGGDFGGLEQFIAGEDTSDGARMHLAVGGMIAAAVRCILVVCKGSAVWRDDLDGWWGWNGHAGREASIKQGNKDTDDD